MFPVPYGSSVMLAKVFCNDSVAFRLTYNCSQSILVEFRQNLSSFYDHVGEFGHKRCKFCLNLTRIDKRTAVCQSKRHVSADH